MHLIWNTVQHGQFSRPIENKDTIIQVERISDQTCDLCSCVDIEVNHTLNKFGHLV